MLAADKIDIEYTPRDKSTKRRFSKTQLEKNWYFRSGCLELYKKYDFSIEQMARLSDGWGFKLFDPDVFSIFDGEVVCSNIEKIIFIGFTEKNEIFNKYFQYNAPLIYTIPQLYYRYGKEFNYKKFSQTFRRFLKTILRL